MPRDTVARSTNSIRTGLRLGFGASAVLWVITLVLTAWLMGPQLTGPPVGAMQLLWIPAAAGVLLLSGLVLVRALRQVGNLESEKVSLLEERDRLREDYDRTRLEALTDGLTGLGNHRAFQDELDQQVTRARTDEGSVALVVVDLDELKQVNESQGHAAGDDLLQATARVIAAVLPRHDRGFRIGGDEFALVLRGCSPDQAVGVARRLLASALSGGSGTLGVGGFSVTIGVSALPDLASDRKQLVHQADAALFWGKRHGRTDVQLFDPRRHGMADDARPLKELAAAVSRVATDRLLTPVYQPIHSLRTGRVLGYEGLVRPRAGSTFANATAMFVAAEATGHTVELDLASLDVVLAGARSIADDLYLSVNLSPRSLESDAFQPQELLVLARKWNIDPTRLVLELTERETVEDMSRLRSALDMLRDHGVRIAADDVGAGNAGLRLLRELSFDIMKIDLSLVQAGTHDDSSEAVLGALKALATRQGQTIVAEGVETPDQLVAVIELGCDAAQGFLLHRPSASLDAEGLDLARLCFPPATSPAGSQIPVAAGV